MKYQFIFLESSVFNGRYFFIETSGKRLQCLTYLQTMAEELLVVLNKKDPTCGLGFSLLGTPGLPPIIYDIVENSPAAESGKVSAFI